jgi:hypothetical protein
MSVINKKQRLTKTMRGKLLKALETGMSLKGACELVCISAGRVGVLMKEGKAGDVLTSEINRAQALAEFALCEKVMLSNSAKDALAMLQTRFTHWDKKQAKSDTPSMQAEALLARLGKIPEVRRN